MKRAFWIWNIPNCEGGDPLKIAAEAVKAGLTDVFVKVADGTRLFGIYSGRDVVPGVVQALRGMGVRVWGWQYIYGSYALREAQIATQRIYELSLDGFIVDAEVEMKKAGASAAETYLKALKKDNPSTEIAFSSYRFPHYHMDFPWQPFFHYCDVNMPQVYWLQATNAAAQTELSIDRFRSLSSLPLMPAGPAWKENGWRPTREQINGFERVCQEKGIPLVSYWSWEHCRRDLPELWPQKTVTEPDRLKKLEDTLAAIAVPISELKNAVTKLETIVSELKEQS